MQKGNWLYALCLCYGRAINSSRRMLSNSSKSVECIAQNCGYSKPSVFCSAFKSKVCMSPIEYRRCTL
ncbi:helix-turn-helix domain-containing protein [Bifidobacterium apicola]|uniref:helix-turn-helix domain-containing protein n=1 Tax=Bifidobacterium TaxID=1678 RepID=UPI0036F24549